MDLKTPIICNIRTLLYQFLFLCASYFYIALHNIIVQCEGESNFKVWEHVRNKRIKNNNLSLDTNDFNPHPILNVDMIPGDAIWIPAYHPHLATSKPSRLSVSFPIRRVIRDDVVFEDREWIKL